MSNPTYECRHNVAGRSSSLEIRDSTDWVSFWSFNEKGSVACDLNESQVQDLIAQLKSWLATRSWVKPKRRFMCFKGDKYEILFEDKHNAIDSFGKYYDEIYELNEENRVK